ncbi:TPA: DUF1294 domain-containing protein [Yersinia enterocolitica]
MVFNRQSTAAKILRCIKRAAHNARHRVPEFTLLLFCFAEGWIRAIFGQ